MPAVQMPLARFSFHNACYTTLLRITVVAELFRRALGVAFLLTPSKSPGFALEPRSIAGRLARTDLLRVRHVHITLVTGPVAAARRNGSKTTKATDCKLRF